MCLLEKMFLLAACHRVDIYRLVKRLGSFLIFLVSCPTSTTTFRFQHCQSINTVLGRFSKFKTPSISVSSFSSSITTFFTGTLKIKLDKSEKLIKSANVEYCIFRLFLHICFLSC